MVPVVASPPDFEGWTAHGWGIRVNSAHALLRAINHIALLEQGRVYAWRGQNDAEYQFVSSLYRRLSASGGPVDERRMRDEEERILLEARAGV